MDPEHVEPEIWEYKLPEWKPQYKSIEPEPFMSKDKKETIGIIGGILGAAAMTALLWVGTATGYKIADDLLRNGNKVADVEHIYWQSYDKAPIHGKALILSARAGFKLAYIYR